MSINLLFKIVYSDTKMCFYASRISFGSLMLSLIPEISECADVMKNSDCRQDNYVFHSMDEQKFDSTYSSGTESNSLRAVQLHNQIKSALQRFMVHMVKVQLHNQNESGSQGQGSNA